MKSNKRIPINIIYEYPRFHTSYEDQLRVNNLRNLINRKSVNISILHKYLGIKKGSFRYCKKLLGKQDEI